MVDVDKKNTDVVPLSPGLELELLDKDNKTLCGEVYKFFKTAPQGMTAYQINNFVLCNRDFPTPDAKWWQVKLELFVRLQAIIGMHYDYRKRKARIRWIGAKISECEDKKLTAQKDYEKEMFDARSEQLRIEIEENEFTLINITKQVSDKLAEMRTFWVAMQDLEGLIEHSKEDKEQQEEDFWRAKAEYTPELKLRFPEVFNISRPEYDKLARSNKK